MNHVYNIYIYCFPTPERSTKTTQKKSGQIIATSYDLGPQKVSKKGEIPLFQGNLGWWNILIWPDKILIQDFYVTTVMR